MKILIPILGFGRSGGYRVLANFADGLISQGHSVTFLVNRHMSEPYFPTRADIRLMDLMGREAIARKGVPIIFNGLTNMWALYRAIHSLAPAFDAIVANHSLTVLPAVAGSDSVAKVIYYIQAYEPEYYAMLPGLKNRIYQTLSRMSYKFNTTRFVNAPIYLSHKEIASEICIPPGFDPVSFHPTPGRILNWKPLVLGCIGRSEPHKGTRDILGAFEALHRMDPRHRLKVAFGNLPTGWSHPNVEVVVPKNDFELGAYYRSLDLLIAAGTIQAGAYHYPVLEALACGTPVIHAGYSPGTLDNSWIAAGGTARALADAVVSYDPDLAASKVAQGLRDVEVLTWAKVSKRFACELEKAITKA